MKKDLTGSKGLTQAIEDIHSHDSMGLTEVTDTTNATKNITEI